MGDLRRPVVVQVSHIKSMRPLNKGVEAAEDLTNVLFELRMLS